MKKFGLILMTMVMSVSFVSCNDSDEEEPIEGGILVWGVEAEEAFSYVLNEASGEASLFDNVGFSVGTVWLTDATISVTNARFSEAMPAISFHIRDLVNTTMSPYEYFITDTDLFPYVGNVELSTYEIDDLKFSGIMRGYNATLQVNYQPIINFTYTVNDIFKVRHIIKTHTYNGDTNVKCEASGSSFDSSSPVYQVTLDPETKTADILIYGAKFAQAMPALNMEFKDVPFDIDLNGFSLAADSLIPEIEDVPYDRYPISNVSASSDYDGNMTLNFVCTIGDVAYEVSADLYLPINE